MSVEEKKVNLLSKVLKLYEKEQQKRAFLPSLLGLKGHCHGDFYVLG